LPAFARLRRVESMEVIVSVALACSKEWTMKSMIARLFNAALPIVSLALLAAAPAARANDLLDPHKFTMKSLLQVDLTQHSATLPLHRGSFRGTTVWYVVTDVSNEALATKLGLNHAPKLANAPHLCPACVQELDMPADLSQAGVVEFMGIPDFAPPRVLVPGAKGFPPRFVQPGGMAGKGYSPLIRPKGTDVVFDIAIVALGDSQALLDKDVQAGNPHIHSITHDRLLALDLEKRTATFLIIRGFAAGQEIVYLSLDATAPDAAVIERSTLTPGLGLLGFPNGDFRKDSARAAIFTFANGQTGATSPPAQGLAHVIVDGEATTDASLGNHRLIAALRRGGDAHNVLDAFPTEVAPFEDEYSPAWDLQIGFWSLPAVAEGSNVAQTDSNLIRTLSTDWTVTSAGGLPLASSGIVVNCPVLAFVNDPPTAPLVPPPFKLPHPHSKDAP
jgi:hypothetical protein